MMVIVPLVFGFCSNDIISLGIRLDALSHLTANVLGHTKVLFLITISSRWVRTRFSWPLPSTLNSCLPTLIENNTFEFGFCNFFFNEAGKSAQLDEALTQIIQSPLGERWDSFVISIVFWWFDLMFSWPENWISNLTAV